MIQEHTKETILEAIRAERLNDARQELGKLDAFAVQSLVEQLPDAQAAVAFRLLDRKTMLEVFESLPPQSQAQLIRSMSNEEAGRLLGVLDADESVQMLEEMPAKVVKQVVGNLAPETRATVNRILNYPDGSAGRRMNPNAFTARRSQRVKDTITAIRQSPFAAEDLDLVFVIDGERFFHGYIQVAELLKADPDAKVIDLTKRAGLVVRTTDPEIQAVRMLRKTDLPAIAVLDTENRLVGAISAEDLVDVAEEEASDLMYQKAGMRDIADKKDHIFSKRLTQGNILYPVRVRMLFLFVTLIGGLIVGGVIDTFEDTLEAVLAAAIFIPLVMDMGGNVGTQSTTIFARGFALGHIDLKRFWSYFLREGSIGLTIGLFLGTLAGVIAYFWQGAPNDIPQLGIAVGVSLFVVITLAAMLGFALPYVMVKLGFDHAPGADPFITTIKDFTGLALYFFLVSTLIGVPEEPEDELAALHATSASAMVQVVEAEKREPLAGK